MASFQVLPEPTDEELRSIINADTAADWADLPQEGTDGGESPRGSFLSILGATGGIRPRTIAAIPSVEYDEAISSWRIGGAVPTAILRASAGLLGMACRLSAGTVVRREIHLAAQAEESNAALKQLELRAQLALSAAGAGTVVTRKVKLSTIVDQANDQEIDLMLEPEVAQAYKVYRDKLGDTPRPEEDVTPEQLAGLKALYKSGQPPYVDLAVWGPFGRR